MNSEGFILNKMKSLLLAPLSSPSSSIPPRIRFSFLLDKCISSSSFIPGVIEDIPSPNTNSVDTNRPSESENSINVLTSQSPISENPVLTQTHVIETLLSYRNDPFSALDYFKWVEKQPGFARGIVYPFCLMLHILVHSGNHYTVARNLLNSYASSNSVPSAIVLVDHFIDCGKRFGFQLNPLVFNYLLNGYVRARRFADAVDCFKAMVSCGVAPWAPIMNNFLSTLAKKNMIDEALNLFNDLILKKTSYDCATVNVMMCACLRRDKVDEAEKYFVEAKVRGMKLDAAIYSTAIRVACMKLEANVACNLLKEMKKMDWVPSEGTFTNLICTCVKQRNLTEALRLKDEMICSGYQISLIVSTSLMKGYCQHGDLNSALELFNEIVEDGLTPTRSLMQSLLKDAVGIETWRRRRSYTRK
ncbi:Pentatricopeptide repeat-containing protein [Abeliophyllum distichum]|uniref:Pentatricopeptide repeat-containing protein n=1 Tax=Abeliophyllum distichum TaxID=126358 RepID=A0ABD1RSC0_9LAMI